MEWPSCNSDFVLRVVFDELEDWAESANSALSSRTQIEPVRVGGNMINPDLARATLPAPRYSNTRKSLSIRIDHDTYEHDVVIDRGNIRQRKRKPSKPFRDDFGHTPLSIKEAIPGQCRRLVIGTGACGGLPVMEAVKREAQRRKIDLIIRSTPQAVETLERNRADSNAILHITY